MYNDGGRRYRSEAITPSEVLALHTPARSKEAKMQESKKGPGNTEPDAEVPADPVAARGADVPRFVDPGPTAKYATTAVARCPCLSITRCTGIALVRAILDPLRDISVNVVQTEPICPETTDGRGLPIVPCA